MKWSAITNTCLWKTGLGPPPFSQSLFFIDCKVAVLNENAPILGPPVTHTGRVQLPLEELESTGYSSLHEDEKPGFFLLPRFLFLAPNRSVRTQQMAF